jgi:hypothetical protein
MWGFQHWWIVRWLGGGGWKQWGRRTWMWAWTSAELHWSLWSISVKSFFYRHNNGEHDENILNIERVLSGQKYKVSMKQFVSQDFLEKKK